MVAVNDWGKTPTAITMYVREPANHQKNASIVVLVRVAPDRFQVSEANT